MFLGTAVHTRLLEPERFAEAYVVAPSSDKRSREYKEFAINNAHKLILTPDQMATCDGIGQNVEQHVSAKTLLRAGYPECTIVWQDQETGIWLKIRPDCLCLSFEVGICVDVKKTTDASKTKFVRSCVDYDYDLQAAVYLEGLPQACKREFDFVFLAAEESAPYGCALYGAPDKMLARGRRRFREALELLKRCREAGQWPGYQPSGEYELLDWPRWAA